MKKFLTICFALTLTQTVGVFANNNKNQGIIRFLTINKVPITSIKWSGCNQNNKPNTEVTTQTQTESQTQATTQIVTESTTETTTQAVTQTTTESTTETTTQATTESQTSSSSSLSAMEQEVVRLVNIERNKQGLSSLEIDEELYKVAKLKSEDMKNNNYFSHTSPTYGSPFDMLKQFNISYKAAGENIAKGQKTAEAVVTAWMNSDGHRQNILSSSYTHIAVAYVDGYWTQLFIGVNTK